VSGEEAEIGRLAERISRLRQARGWSRAELARRSGLDQSTVWRLEARSRNNPEATTLRALARALDTTMEDLLGLGPRAQATEIHYDRAPAAARRQSGPPPARGRQVPLVIDPSSPPAGTNVVGSVPVPDLLGIDREDLFALSLDEHTADGSWPAGTIVFCVPGSSLSDTDTVLLLMDGRPRVRKLRIIGDTLLAQSPVAEELVPIAHRDILARVMAVLHKL